MQRFTKAWLKTDLWAGAFESAQEELIATDGRDGAEMQGNRRLKSFAKAPGGVRVGPCRGTLHAQHPPRPTSPLWIHRGSHLAELKKAKIMVQMGRNSRAPLRVFTPAQSVSPPREKPSSSHPGSLKKQHQLHAQLNKQHLFSKYPSFPAGKRPRLLLPSSSSRPGLRMLEAPGQRRTLRTPTPRLEATQGRDELQHPTRGRSDALGAEGKMESGG